MVYQNSIQLTKQQDGQKNRQNHLNAQNYKRMKKRLILKVINKYKYFKGQASKNMSFEEDEEQQFSHPQVVLTSKVTNSNLDNDNLNKESLSKLILSLNDKNSVLPLNKNLYLTLKALNNRYNGKDAEKVPNLSINVAKNKGKNKDKEKECQPQSKPQKTVYQLANIQDQMVVIKMHDIHLAHRDYAYWRRESLLPFFEPQIDAQIRQSKVSIIGKGQQGNNNKSVKTQALFNKKTFKNGNQNEENLSDYLLENNINRFTNFSCTLPQKLKGCFCLFSQGQQGSLSGACHQLNRLRPYEPKSSENRMQYIQNNLSWQMDKEILYRKKLERCKQVAHAYVYSGYGYKKVIAHGFNMSMRKHRLIIQSILRVIFRQLQKFVHGLEKYKEKYKEKQSESLEHYQESDSDHKQNIPYKEFKYVIVTLYHVRKKFPEEIYRVWLQLMKITFNLQPEKKPENNLSEKQLINCYEAIKRRIKELGKERLQAEMKRIGITASNSRGNSSTKRQNKDGYCRPHRELNDFLEYDQDEVEQEYN